MCVQHNFAGILTNWFSVPKSLQLHLHKHAKTCWGQKACCQKHPLQGKKHVERRRHFAVIIISIDVISVV